MATEQQVSVVPATDEDRAIATITIAFSNDPVTRWVFPDANVYLSYWPRLVKAFGGAAFAEGTADSIDRCGGVAVWFPPGVGSDEETMDALVAEAVPVADREEVFGFMGQWASSTSPNRTGTCRSSVSMSPSKAAATAPRCSATHSNAATGMDCPPLLRRRVR